jgi:hypothetical protein
MPGYKLPYLSNKVDIQDSWYSAMVFTTINLSRGSILGQAFSSSVPLTFSMMMYLAPTGFCLAFELQARTLDTGVTRRFRVYERDHNHIADLGQ